MVLCYISFSGTALFLLLYGSCVSIYWYVAVVMLVVHIVPESQVTVWCMSSSVGCTSILLFI